MNRKTMIAAGLCCAALTQVAQAHSLYAHPVPLARPVAVRLAPAWPAVAAAAVVTTAVIASTVPVRPMAVAAPVVVRPVDRFDAADLNRDGRLDRYEAVAIPRVARHFRVIDRNNDGLVGRHEIAAFDRHHGFPSY